MAANRPQKHVEIELEILEQSYWEHFKSAKDLALYFPLNHPRRQRIDQELSILVTRLNTLKDEKR